MFSETNIIKMLEFLIGNIFVMFGGRVFQQTVGIPMDTNCALLLADLFLYSYEADFIQGASLIAATLHQENPDMNHKLCNVVSTERYILHM
jgi:hypothetical protein